MTPNERAEKIVALVSEARKEPWRYSETVEKVAAEIKAAEEAAYQRGWQACKEAAAKAADTERRICQASSEEGYILAAWVGASSRIAATIRALEPEAGR